MSLSREALEKVEETLGVMGERIPPDSPWHEVRALLASHRALEAEVRLLDGQAEDWFSAHNRVQAERDAARAEVRRMVVAASECRQRRFDLERHLNAARAEVERLRDALDGFGQHGLACAWHDVTTSARCDCGYLDALRGGEGE